MAANLVILVPVLRRPSNIYPLVYSIKESTSESYEILFITSPGDTEEIKELEDRKLDYIVMEDSFEGKGDYARKINSGFNHLEAKWYFLGADDLRFHPNWFEAAMDVYEKTEACVIGTNDLGNPQVTRGQHSTHSLVLGEYVRECGTVDESGKVLHEGYRHNFVDAELITTAKWRGAWAFAKNSVVEHRHPDWQKGIIDEVYKIGKNSFHLDQQYFETRRKLWM